MQKQGFPNITVQLYDDYNAYMDNSYIDMTPSLISLTMRDGLISGINEGLLQVHDEADLHTKLTGEEFIRVVVSTANSEVIQTRVYSIARFSLSIDKKADNVITFQLNPYHLVNDIMYSRSLPNNAGNAMTSMMSALYADKPLIKPKTNFINIRVPATNWCGTLDEYKKFIGQHGMSVEKESMPMVYEWFDGIEITDYQTITEEDYLTFMMLDPDIVGSMGDFSENPILFDFEWLIKKNAHKRMTYEDMTYYVQDIKNKNLRFTVVGDGHDRHICQRSGAYEGKLDKVGQDENKRFTIMSKNEGYSKATIYGDFRIKPTQKIYILEPKTQTKQTFYVDEVLHEVSRTQSLTTLYMINE